LLLAAAYFFFTLILATLLCRRCAAAIYATPLRECRLMRRHVMKMSGRAPMRTHAFMMLRAVMPARRQRYDIIVWQRAARVPQEPAVRYRSRSEARQCSK